MTEREKAIFYHGLLVGSAMKKRHQVLKAAAAISEPVPAEVLLAMREEIKALLDRVMRPMPSKIVH